MKHDLPAHIRGRAFSVAAAIHAGVSPGVLRRRGLQRPFHGVRIDADVTPSFEASCRAYATRLRPGQYYSHSTAARLHGMWLPARLEAQQQLHVTAALPTRPPQASGVIGHTIRGGDARMTMVRGLPVAHPVDAWRMLSTLLTVDELVVAGDFLVKRKNPLATMAELADAVRRHRGRRGYARLAQAFDLVRAGVDSPKETEIRLLVVRAGLPEPQVNVVISTPGGRQRRGDLVFPEYGTVLEYEGGQHESDRPTYVSDIARFEELSGEWRFVRIVKEHLRDTHALLARIEAALRAGGWRP